MARRILGLELDYRSPRSVYLWMGILAPPLAWGAHVVLGDGMFELGCARAFGQKAILGIPLSTASIIASAILAAISLLAGFLAYLAWRGLRREANGTAHGRAAAMAIMGVASGAFYFVIIGLQLIAPFLLRACERPL